MGVIDAIRRTFGRKNSTWELWRELYGSRDVKSGARVNHVTALEVTTVLGCAGVIADSIATIPFKLFKKTGRQRVEAGDHPLAQMFAGQVNPWQNSVEFREQIALHLALVRNAYVFQVRVRGAIRELIPFEPQWVTVEREADYSLRYKVRPPGGQEQVFAASQIWHIKAHPNWSGFFASDVVQLAREAIGLAMVTEEAHARMHKNGAQIGGLYSVEGTLTPEQHQRLTTWISQAMAGSGNSGKIHVMDRAAKFEKSGMTGVDSQHIETRRFQIEEICRAMHVLPIMVGHYDKSATYASAEQMFLAHAVHYARPWHRRLEASANVNLLSADERAEGYYFKFLDAELLRGAAATRADYYGKGIKDGWLLRNEAREYEELDPLDGLDVPLMPLNMADGGDPPNPDPAHSDPPADPAAQ